MGSGLLDRPRQTVTGLRKFLTGSVGVEGGGSGNDVDMLDAADAHLTQLEDPYATKERSVASNDSPPDQGG